MTDSTKFVSYDGMESVAAEVASQESSGFVVSTASDDGIWFMPKENEVPLFNSSDDAYDYWKSLNR